MRCGFGWTPRSGWPERRVLRRGRTVPVAAQRLPARIWIGYTDKFRLRAGTGRSSNGRTRGSGPRYRGSNPCLPAKFDPRVGISHNFKHRKHFVTASTLSPTRRPFSQPNPDSWVVFAEQIRPAMGQYRPSDTFERHFDQKTGHKLPSGGRCSTFDRALPSPRRLAKHCATVQEYPSAHGHSALESGLSAHNADARHAPRSV